MLGASRPSRYPAYSPARLPLFISAGQRSCLLAEQTVGVESGRIRAAGIVVSVCRPYCIFGHSGWQARSRAVQRQTSRTPKHSEVHVRAVSLLTPLGWGATRGWPPGSAACRDGPRPQRNDQHQALRPRVRSQVCRTVVVRVGPGDDGADGELLAAAVPTAVSLSDERALLSVDYTSGSTGRGKGAMHHHRGACLQVLAMVTHSRMSASSRTPCRTTTACSDRSPRKAMASRMARRPSCLCTCCVCRWRTRLVRRCDGVRPSHPPRRDIAPC
ncbi:AMP-binding protein [Streptomyces mirabilis]|uniref:AMP-binding protein n=1 Tax=Streptomyces mirabilis TaxID=68239 RepID=UPI0033A3032B